MASSLSKSGSKKPPFASKAAAYKIVSSVDKKFESLLSSSLCIVWVPQINLTEDIP